MINIRFKATEFRTGHEVIRWTYASGRGEAILLAGRCYVVEGAEVERLAAARVELAYLCDCEMSDGTHGVIAVPFDD